MWVITDTINGQLYYLCRRGLIFIPNCNAECWFDEYTTALDILPLASLNDTTDGNPKIIKIDAAERGQD
jgi:hypothetical protein